MAAMIDDGVPRRKAAGDVFMPPKIRSWSDGAGTEERDGRIMACRRVGGSLTSPA
jgi:hypothetical protein